MGSAVCSGELGSMGASLHACCHMMAGCTTEHVCIPVCTFCRVIDGLQL